MRWPRTGPSEPFWLSLPRGVAVGFAIDWLCEDRVRWCPSAGWRCVWLGVLLCLDGDPVGAVVRIRKGVKTVFVSPGHRADIRSAVALVQESPLLSGYLNRNDELIF